MNGKLRQRLPRLEPAAARGTADVIVERLQECFQCRVKVLLMPAGEENAVSFYKVRLNRRKFGPLRIRSAGHARLEESHHALPRGRERHVHTERFRIIVQLLQRVGPRKNGKVVI